LKQHSFAVIRKFRAAKITSLIAAAAFTLLFVVLWPGTMLRSEMVIRFYFRFLHVLRSPP
jgi:hypothetical protein